MTAHQRFEAVIRELSREFGNPDEDDLKVARKIFDAGQQAGAESLAKRAETAESTLEVSIMNHNQVWEAYKRFYWALESISKNSCCDSCQEAKLVALKALYPNKESA